MKLNRTFLLLITILFAQSVNSQFTILENNRYVLRLKWEINDVDTISTIENGMPATIVAFNGQNTIVMGKKGCSPGYRLWVGIPPVGNATIAFVPEQMRDVQLHHPLSKQQCERSSDSAVSEDTWISQIEYKSLRDIRAVSIVVSPVNNGNDGNIQVCTKGVLTISFPTCGNMVNRVNNSEYEKMLATLLINYDVAKMWHHTSSLNKKNVLWKFPLDNKKVYHFRVGDGHSSYNEGTTKENGLIKIKGSEILSIFGTATMSQVQLFGSFKGELPESESSNIPSGLVEIPLLRVDKNHDNLVDSSDYFIAYVTGSSDWRFENGDYTMKINRYDDFRNYWLTVGGNGATIKAAEQYVAVGNVTDKYVAMEYVREPKFQSKKSEEGGLNWVWETLSAKKPSRSIHLDFPETGISAAKITIYGDTYDGNLYYSAGQIVKSPCEFNVRSEITEWNDHTIRFGFDAFSNSEDTSKAEIEAIEIRYDEKLHVKNNEQMIVYSDTGTGILTYRMDGFGSELVYIFRIAQNEKIIKYIDTVRSPADGVYLWTDSTGQGTQYLICPESALRVLPPHEAYPVSKGKSNCITDLVDQQNQADYLIITHPDFMGASEKLAEHKKTMGFVKPAIVDINDIYRYFSGGNLDPVAIRNFIAYVHNSGWKEGEVLEYILLMGGTHYDIKNVRGNNRVFIPTYYEKGSIYDKGSMPQDDFFCRIKGVPVKTIGRIPCLNLTEAQTVIEKIREYELPGTADFGEWRNRVMFVSDDDEQAGKKDKIEGHNKSSDNVAFAFEKCLGSIDKRVVSLFEYAFDNNRCKPGASTAIVNQINSGAGVVCFYGHGSVNLWTDEHVMTNDKVLLFNNQKKYPLIASFSCSVGNFDQSGQCLSSSFVFANKAGAIASIGSSRASYPGCNEMLGASFFGCVLDSNRSVSSMGYMLISAKMIAGPLSYRYHLFGDPSVKLIKSIKKIELSVTDNNGIPLTGIKAGQKIMINGKVLNGEIADNTYGTSNDPAFVHIGIFNPPYNTSRKDGITREVKYSLPGKPVFMGKVQVKNGLFSQQIKIGDNVTFNKPGVRLIAYSWSKENGDAGSGYRDDLIFNDAETGVRDDSIGPGILIRPLYEDKKMNKSSIAFSDGITVTLPFQCEIIMQDESGIDVTGVGPDEGLSYYVPGFIPQQNINQNFQFDEGDFRKGRAALDFNDNVLKKGVYKLFIYANDLSGNRSESVFDLTVIDGEELSLDHVVNFPNPMTIGGCTKFYYNHSSTSQLSGNGTRAVVRIYTLNGKLIKVIKDAENGQIWDGRDQRGYVISPDVYLYQIEVFSSSLKKHIKSKVCKLVIHPPH